MTSKWVALVTGAAGSICQAVVERFSADGFGIATIDTTLVGVKALSSPTRHPTTGTK